LPHEAANYSGPQRRHALISTRWQYQFLALQLVLYPSVSFSIRSVNMRSFLIASLASLATISGTQAHPYHDHRARGISRRGVDLDSFRMKVPVSYTNAAAVGSDASISALTRRASAEDTATELVKKTVPSAKFRLVQSYTGSNGVAHFFFKQTANGVDIDNGDFNVNVSGNEQSKFAILQKQSFLP